MKTSAFTEEQITYTLRQVELGTPVAEVCRKLGISEQTFYRWKRRFAGMGVAELRRLRQLEEENRKLKQLVADLTLDKHMLQEVIQKKLYRPLSAGSWCSLCGSAFRAVSDACAR
jgi:putative transposase